MCVMLCGFRKVYLMKKILFVFMRSSTPVPLLFHRKPSKSDVQLKISLTNVTKSFVENPVKYLFSGSSNL